MISLFKVVITMILPTDFFERNIWIRKLVLSDRRGNGGREHEGSCLWLWPDNRCGHGRGHEADSFELLRFLSNLTHIPPMLALSHTNAVALAVMGRWFAAVSRPLANVGMSEHLTYCVRWCVHGCGHCHGSGLHGSRSCNPGRCCGLVHVRYRGLFRACG